MLFSEQDKPSLVDFDSQNSNLSSKLLILPSQFDCQSQFDRYSLCTNEIEWSLGCDALKPHTHHSPQHFNNNVSLSFDWIRGLRVDPKAIEQKVVKLGKLKLGKYSAGKSSRLITPLNG